MRMHVRIAAKRVKVSAGKFQIHYATFLQFVSILQPFHLIVFVLYKSGTFGDARYTFPAQSLQLYDIYDQLNGDCGVF